MDNNTEFYTEDIEIFKGIIKEKTNNGIVVSAFNTDPFSKEQPKTKTVSQTYLNYSPYRVGQSVVVTTYKTIKPAINSDPIHPTNVSSTRVKVETLEQYVQRINSEAEKKEEFLRAQAMPSHRENK